MAPWDQLYYLLSLEIESFLQKEELKVGKIDASAFIQNNSEQSQVPKEIVRVGKLGKTGVQ